MVRENIEGLAEVLRERIVNKDMDSMEQEAGGEEGKGNGEESGGRVRRVQCLGTPVRNQLHTEWLIDHVLHTLKSDSHSDPHAYDKEETSTAAAGGE